VTDRPEPTAVCHVAADGSCALLRMSPFGAVVGTESTAAGVVTPWYGRDIAGRWR
jgi:hypothetical protein